MSVTSRHIVFEVVVTDLFAVSQTRAGRGEHSKVIFYSPPSLIPISQE